MYEYFDSELAQRGVTRALEFTAKLGDGVVSNDDN